MAKTWQGGVVDMTLDLGTVQVMTNTNIFTLSANVTQYNLNASNTAPYGDQVSLTPVTGPPIPLPSGCLSGIDTTINTITVVDCTNGQPIIPLNGVTQLSVTFPTSIIMEFDSPLNLPDPNPGFFTHLRLDLGLSLIHI